MDAWTFLAAPFVASLILAGIHTYLGVHVVERGVIFVDLSLAQIAALGAAVAILYGTDAHSASTYWISVAFTLIGAAVFANVRSRKARIPQEAIIGICYAVASAATILAMSKARGEIEHLQEMLVGNLLFVSWDQVGKTALLYGAIGLFHYIFRKKFLAISANHELENVQRRLGARLGPAVLRLVRLRGDLVGVDRRRAAGVLLPDRAVGGRHAVRANHRPAADDRLGHGHAGFDAGHVPVAEARPADRADDRLHVRAGAGCHGGGQSSPTALAGRAGARLAEKPSQ